MNVWRLSVIVRLPTHNNWSAASSALRNPSQKAGMEMLEEQLLPNVAASGFAGLLSDVGTEVKMC